MRGAQALPSLLPLFLALSSLSVVSAASGKQDQVLVCPLRFIYFLFLLTKSTLKMVQQYCFERLERLCASKEGGTRRVTEPSPS